jgi:hypothetical protein
MYPVLAVMKLTGLDWADFAKRFCEARDEEVARMSSASESDTLFDTLLSTPVTFTSHGEGPTTTTIRRLLGSRDTRAIINEMSTGVFYTEEDNLLIVHWSTAIAAILAATGKYRNGDTFNPARLKMVAERHALCVKTKTAQKKYPGLAMYVREKCGPGIGLAQVSLFDLRSLIGDVTVTSTTAAPATTTVDPREIPVLDADIQI